MKNTTNVFLKGMTSDMHPLTTSQQEYTDALNATLVTFNGNEQMMQNDMGNTKIQDSKTGNIMGLREGFIPVGLKEHGGIMYIASVNKDGEGEIGTIPSPVIRYNKSKDYCNLVPVDLTATPSTPSPLYKLTNEKLTVGEKFVVALQLNDDTKDFKIPCIDSETENSINLTYPYYSNSIKSGLYKVNLFAQTDDQIFDLSDQITLESGMNYLYEVKDPSIIDNSKKYWFANIIDSRDASEVVFDTDYMCVSENTDENNDNKIIFIHYPNIPAGYPSINFTTETINSFTLTTNEAQDQVYPLTKYESEQYWAIFPAFVYTTDSAVHINKIVVSVEDENGVKQNLYKCSDPHVVSTELSFEVSSELNRYLKSVNELTEYWLIDSGVSDISEVPQSTIINFETVSTGALFEMLIGGDLNRWFTLHVDYYDSHWDDEKVGEYTLKFNQYVMDVLHRFFEYEIKPETDYDDSETGMIEQKYDKSRDNGNIIPTSDPITTHPIVTITHSVGKTDFNVGHIIEGAITIYSPNNFTALPESPIDYLYIESSVDRSVQSTIQIPPDLNFPTPGYFSINPTDTCDFKTAYDTYTNRLNGTISAPDNGTGILSAIIKCTLTIKNDLDNPGTEYTYSLTDECAENRTRSGGTWGTTTYREDWAKIRLNPSGAIAMTLEEINVRRILQDTFSEWASKNIPSWKFDESYITPTKYKIEIIRISLSGDLTRSQPGSGGGVSVDVHSGDDQLWDGGTGVGTITFTPDPNGNTTLENVTLTCNTTFSTETQGFSNLSDYEICPQFNLYGRDKTSSETTFEGLGITTVGNDKILTQSNIITTNKLSNFLQSDVFFSTNINSGSSLADYGNVIYRRQGNNDLHVQINKGDYYLGGSLSILKEDANSGLYELQPESEVMSTYIELTFVDTSGTSISVRLGSGISTDENLNDYWYIRSGKEGCLIHFEHDATLTSLNVQEDIDTGLIYIQDLGLYELSPNINEDCSKHIEDFINSQTSTNFTYNHYEADGQKYGYYYVVPQLCWTYEENQEDKTVCLMKKYNSYNNAAHAFQIRCGVYKYYDDEIHPTEQTVETPTGERFQITYRNYKENADN